VLIGYTFVEDTPMDRVNRLAEFLKPAMEKKRAWQLSMSVPSKEPFADWLESDTKQPDDTEKIAALLLRYLENVQPTVADEFDRLLESAGTPEASMDFVYWIQKLRLSKDDVVAKEVAEEINKLLRRLRR
jgi:hypothetical protein